MTDTTKLSVAAHISGNQVSVLVNRKYRTVPADSEKGRALIAALKEKPQDVEKICQLADIALWAAQHSFGRVVVDDRDQIRLDGKIVDYGVAIKLHKMITEGWDVTPLTNYIERVSQNPDETIAERLHEFISVGELPMTPEGCFLAFKRVQSDYYSFHSGQNGKVLHLPNTMVEEVNPDEDRTHLCSRGLHACSHAYLNGFYSNNPTSKELIVLIDPKDVLAISNSERKLRCVRYFVVGELEKGAPLETHFEGKAVDNRYTAPDAPEPAAPVESEIVKDEAYWAEQGCKEGREHANEDRVGGHYSIEPSVPEEIGDQPAFRSAYAQSYVKCYEETYSEDQSSKIMEAYEVGLKDGESNASQADDETFDADPAEGESYDDYVDDDARLMAYERGFKLAYARRYTLDEFASERLQVHGKEDGEEAARNHHRDGIVYSNNPHESARWSSLPTHHEPPYEKSYTLAYAETYETLDPIIPPTAPAPAPEAEPSDGSEDAGC